MLKLPFLAIIITTPLNISSFAQDYDNIYGLDEQLLVPKEKFPTTIKSGLDINLSETGLRLQALKTGQQKIEHAITNLVHSNMNLLAPAIIETFPKPLLWDVFYRTKVDDPIERAKSQIHLALRVNDVPDYYYNISQETDLSDFKDMTNFKNRSKAILFENASENFREHLNNDTFNPDLFVSSIQCLYWAACVDPDKNTKRAFVAQAIEDLGDAKLINAPINKESKLFNVISELNIRLLLLHHHLFEDK